MTIDELTTPALLVDLDAMESNLHAMAGYFANKPAKLRPHFKNHKSPMLAWKQIRAGAIGMTCATLREAEILVQHGVDNILIANEIAGETKSIALAELSRLAIVIAAVDSVAAVRDLARAQRNRGSQIKTVIDVNIGLNRCGVPPGEEVLELAWSALDQGLEVCGIMGYDGHHQVLPPSEERDEQVRMGAECLVHSAELLRANRIPVDILSTGGTGTYNVAGVYPGVTEIQAGSYLLMDTLYQERGSKFRRSLSVLTTVLHSSAYGHAVVDCGLKAISSERGLPDVKDADEIELKALHAEHGLLHWNSGASNTLAVGQKLQLNVRYSDATLNLHSRLFGVRNGTIEEVFHIEH
jgi:D-serine deaminase-like pyridoxal phosphate-dependent protein